MGEYRLDRTAFKAQTADEAVKRQAEYSRSLTWQERLRVTNYLNSVAYNYPKDNPPKLDRTAFRARNQAEINAVEDAKVKQCSQD